MLYQFKMNILIKILCLMVFLPNIKSDCIIQYIDDIEVFPKFEKSVGKFKIRIPFNGNNKLNYIKLYDGETLYGLCETYFSPIIYNEIKRLYSYNQPRRLNNGYDSTTSITPNTILNQTSIVLHCRNSALFHNDIELPEQKFSCVEQSYSIYSTKQPYSWCEKHKISTTFLFAIDKAIVKNILAAICFNIDQVALQTLFYNTTNLRRINLSQPIGIKTSQYLDEKLWNFKTSIISQLSEQILQEKLTEMSKVDEWLNLANYEVSLIVQNELLMKCFKGYENILNVIWWRNLRVGNWKRFQNTLTNYAQNNSYEVYIGTSGVAQYPANEKDYNKEKYFKIELGFQNETIPAYIWTYLKSIDNLNQEFVMVGYNSPYADYFTTKEVIFCPDICSEIPWLKKISKSFRYTNAGIMFCCSTDFIRQTKYLQGFPIDNLMIPQIVSTVETTTAMTDLITNYDKIDENLYKY